MVPGEHPAFDQRTGAQQRRRGCDPGPLREQRIAYARIIDQFLNNPTVNGVKINGLLRKS
ncbi:hypothetical protein GCM10009715_18750 [Paeniglutamicibacter psychrophenolicus]